MFNRNLNLIIAFVQFYIILSAGYSANDIKNNGPQLQLRRKFIFSCDKLFEFLIIVREI